MFTSTGGVENNGYNLTSLSGEHYIDLSCSESTSDCWLEKPEGAPENVYILFQLEGSVPTDEFQFIVNEQSTDAEGKLWITPEMFQEEGRYFYYTLLRRKTSPSLAGKTYAYTLTLYASQDTSTTPLAVFSGSQTVKRMVWLRVTPNRITGDLSTSIPFTVTVEANDFVGTPDAMLVIRKNEGVSITSKDLEQLQGTELSQSNYYHYFRIGELQNDTYNFTLSSTQEFRQTIEISIVDGNGQHIPNSSWVQVSVPFNVSQTDIDGLEKIANDNNNAYLRDYVSNERYLNSSREDSIYIEWDDNLSPARISNLNFMFQSLTTLDVSAFDSLMYLTVNHAAIDKLDLSMLKRLRGVGLHNTGITSLNQVKLPDNPDLEVRGSYEIAVGKQINEYTCQLVSGEQVNLSEYATIDGEPTTIKWFKSSDSGSVEVTAEWVETAPYIFVVPALKEEDAEKWVRYWCEISTARYPEWKGCSRNIQIVRGANIDYSEDDIQLLKNLAAANPNCHELQQFVADTVKGWEESWQESWVDRNRKVAVDWNYETPARINRLRISDLSTVTNLDLSGFTELTYLDITHLSEWSKEQQKYIGLKTLDLTKNTKLRQLEAQSNYGLKSLNTSGLTALEIVSVRGNTELTGLDLAASRSVLSNLNLERCQFDIDLMQFTALRVLNLDYTSQYGNYLDKLVNLEVLNCCGTKYPLLDFSKYPNLTDYGVPMGVPALDITNTRISGLNMSGSQVRYSTLKAGSNVIINGGSQIPIPNLPESTEYPEWKRSVYDIAVGDTVDLSSEAYIDNIASRYLWVDETNQTESTGVFIPVEGAPGKFVYKGGGRPGKFYHCIIANERYSKYTEVNRWNGWRLETYPIQLPEIKATYEPTEVAALKAIVDGTDSPALKQWWESEAWKTGSGTDPRFGTSWILDEGTNIYHLGYLQLLDLGDTLKTLNVDAFTELVDLNCNDNGIEELSLQKNAKLEFLQVDSCPHLKTVALPDAKERLRSLNICWSYELDSLDVSGYTNLDTLNLRGCNSLTYAGELSQLVNLEYLWLNNTLLEPLKTDSNNYSKLKRLGVPRKTKALDASRIENLEDLDVGGSMLTISTLQLKNTDSCFVHGWTYPDIEGIKKVTNPDGDEFTPFYLFPANEKIDLSSEMVIGDEPTYVFGADGSDGLYTVRGNIHDRVTLQWVNLTYGDWAVVLMGQIVSCKGDANLDTKVDVRDLVVTANYIVQNEDALPEDQFGRYEADVDDNNSVDAVDMQKIVNLILKPATKGTIGLRGGYVPAVELSVENGYLYMEAEVPVTALQLELTGMTQTEPLLGKAAGLTQVSAAGDTTRILGYSFKGVAIPAGKSVLMKFPAGARLAKAVFSDEKAQRLEVRTKGDIATSNETIRPMDDQRIGNYPNPFRGTTTLVYRLDEAADDVCLQVFSFNGALVEIVGGLPAAAGENRFVYSARLGAGTYLYRLAVRNQGKTSYSKSNTFIIK
ncbi:hypothetical protein [Parabacteroides sp. ZJ-118]|uniref:hypothetical protein n=1 Tax=Parabacteroides sp. ZJ-118 TaxID=2709398 RepID=UPI0013EC0F15|nr:hypothetical protein [Parabacteroides sp. ZJ-118]